jgi:hypothetical protein
MRRGGETTGDADIRDGHGGLCQQSLRPIQPQALPQRGWSVAGVTFAQPFELARGQSDAGGDRAYVETLIELALHHADGGSQRWRRCA